MNLKNVKKVKPTSNNISVIRTVTPLSHFIQNKNKINFTSNNSNNELSAISNTNLNITFFDINQSNKKAKKNKYSSSVSPQIERNNNIQNKCYDILKSRSISKKKIDKYCQMLSNYSKTKIEKKSKSISKGKLSRAVHQNEINKNNFKRLQKALKDEATRLINEFIDVLYKGLKEKDKPDQQTPLHLSAISKFPLSYKVIYQILEYDFFIYDETWDEYL